MRRRYLHTLMLIFLFAELCGCGTSSADRALTLDLQEAFLSMERWSGTADLTADYGQRVYSYSVSFSGSVRDGMKLTITAPDDVAGITASVEKGQTFLSYDGIRLETGPLNPEGLSPLDAIPALLSAMRTGYIAETGSESMDGQEVLRITCRDSSRGPGEGTETVLWFDKARRTLLFSEIRSDGATVVRCRFSDFTYT